MRKNPSRKDLLPALALSAGLAGHLLLGVLQSTGTLPADSRWLSPGTSGERWDREMAVSAVANKKHRAALWLERCGTRPLPEDWFYNRYLGWILFARLEPYVRLTDDPERRRKGAPAALDFEPWIRPAYLRWSEANSRFQESVVAFYENPSPDTVDRCRATWPELEAAFEELDAVIRLNR